MIGKLLLWAGIVVLILATAAFASPLLGLQSLRDALADRDDSKLVSLVDIDRLRANVTSRVRARYTQAAIKLPVEPVVEHLITPLGLISAICDGGAVVCGAHAIRTHRRNGRHGSCRAALATGRSRIAFERVRPDQEFRFELSF
jgi:hypothetical protein